MVRPQSAAAGESPEFKHAGITFAVMAGAAAAYSLLQTVLVPALPVIEKDLGTSTTATTWLLSAFLLSSSVMAPIMGRLGDMFGKVRVLTICMALMCLGLLISAAGDVARADGCSGG